MSDESTAAPAPAAPAEGTVLTPAAAPEDQTNTPPAGEGEQPPPGDGEQNPPEAEGQGGEGDGTEPPQGEGDQAAAAPEEYTDFELAEGLSVNEEGMNRFGEFAKEQNMPQEQAQQTLDYIAKEMPGFLQEVQQQQLDAYMQQTKDWKEAYVNDPKIGGTHMQDTETNAQRAIQYLNDPELVSLLDAHNPESNPNGMSLGNHRAFINLLAQFGKTLKEDTFEGGDQNQGGGNSDTIEERWYGKGAK